MGNSNFLFGTCTGYDLPSPAFRDTFHFTGKHLTWQQQKFFYAGPVLFHMKGNTKRPLLRSNVKRALLIAKHPLRTMEATRLRIGNRRLRNAKMHLSSLLEHEEFLRNAINDPSPRGKTEVEEKFIRNGLQEYLERTERQIEAAKVELEKAKQGFLFPQHTVRKKRQS